MKSDPVEQFPQEVLLHLFSFFRRADDQENVAMVSTKWRNTMRLQVIDEQKKLFQQVFPKRYQRIMAENTPVRNWKTLYKRTCQEAYRYPAAEKLFKAWAEKDLDVINDMIDDDYFNSRDLNQGYYNQVEQECFLSLILRIPFQKALDRLYEEVFSVEEKAGFGMSLGLHEWLELPIVCNQPVEVLRALIKDHKVDGWGIGCALSTACRFARLPAARFLVEECKATVDTKMIATLEVLQSVCQYGTSDMVRYLLNNPNVKKLLSEEDFVKELFESAIKGGKVDILRDLTTYFDVQHYLKENNIRPDDFYGPSILLATKEGHKQAVAYLQRCLDRLSCPVVLGERLKNATRR